MTRNRGIGQYEPKPVESHVRSLYEFHRPLRDNDYLFDGQLSSGSLIIDLPAGSSTDILVQVGSTADVYYNIKPEYVTNGRSSVQKFLNVGVNTVGTELEIAQQRSDFVNNIENLTITKNNDVDTTTARTFPERLASTARGGNSGGSHIDGESVLVAPGDNLCIRLQNRSNGDIDSTIYLRINPIPANLVGTITEQQ